MYKEPRGLLGKKILREVAARHEKIDTALVTDGKASLYSAWCSCPGPYPVMI